MLSEWLTWLLAPCRPAYRRLGHLRELVAMQARHRRCRRAWAPHLEACRRLIIEGAERCPSRRTALVAGSGLLLDIPLDYLAERFETVILADLVHLRPVRRRAARFPNVRLAEVDLTGVLEDVLALPAGARTLPGPPVPAFLQGPDDPPVDLVVSANLMSQLSLCPLARLTRRLAGPPDAAERTTVLADFAAALPARHLEWLERFTGVVCLVTDVERMVVDNELVLESADPLYGLTLPGWAQAGGREWIWDIAPRPEAFRRADRRNRVRGAIRDAVRTAC
jgi:hypothetical protein